MIAMNVFSILNILKVDAKYLVSIIFVLGLIYKSGCSDPPATKVEDDADINVKDLPYCDENLINDRAVTKR